MITLTIGNSGCQILGLETYHFKRLRVLLSYMDDPKKSYFNPYASLKRYLIHTSGKFPTGLLYLVERYIESEGLVVDKQDNRQPPASRGKLFTLSLSYPPYPEQIAAAEACRAFKRGIVVAPTGCGKSLVATLIINTLQVPTLVVVPSLELKRQLIETLSAAFGQDKVGNLELNRLIAVENVDALHITRPIVGYDCVIIDEFHHSGAKTYRKLNTRTWPNIYYKFGLTATPFRSQDHERLLLESVLSKVIYRIEYNTAVDKGYIVPMKAYYVDVPTTKGILLGSTWSSVYSTLVVNNETRNALIHKILLKSNAKNISTLCLVKEISHGNILSADGAFRFINGVNNERQLVPAFNSGHLKTLIGTVGVLGEGIDTKPAELVIIAGLGKSRNQFMQNCGRGMRKLAGKEFCNVIIFKDLSHKWTRAHYQEQVKILKEEYGVTPKRLEIILD